MSNTVTVMMKDGETKRITLPGAAWEGREETGTGHSITAVYIGTISKRVIVETYSQWQGDKPTSYHEADTDECARIAELIPEIEEALDGIHKPETL